MAEDKNSKTNNKHPYRSKKVDLSKTSQAVADLQKTLDSLKSYNENRIKDQNLADKEKPITASSVKSGVSPNTSSTLQKNKAKQEESEPSTSPLLNVSSPKDKVNTPQEKHQDVKPIASKPSVDSAEQESNNTDKAPEKGFNLLGKFSKSKTDGNSVGKNQEPLSKEENKITPNIAESEAVKENTNQTSKPSENEKGEEKPKKNILFNKLSGNKDEAKKEELKDHTSEGNEQAPVIALGQEALGQEVSKEETTNQEETKEEKVQSSAALGSIFDHAQESTELSESLEDDEKINLKVMRTSGLHHDENFIKSVSSSVKGEIEELDQIVDREGNVLSEETKKRDNSRYLKVSFAKVVDMFQVSVDQDVLFANISEAKNNIINTAFLAEAGKRADIRVEINRINLVDIKVNNCILLLKNGKNLVVVDEETVYDPEQDAYLEFDRQEVSRHYIGYAMFFHNQEFSVTEFLKKSTIFSGYVKSNIPMFLEILVLSFLINMFVIVTPFYTINIYDRVIPNNAIETLIVLSTGMALVYIFDFVFKVVRSYITDYVSSDIGNSVDKTLMEKMLGAKSSGITMSNGGKINLFKELQSIREFYFSRFIPSLIDMPFVVLFLFVLFIISPVMSLVPLVGVFIIFIVNILFQVPLQSSYGDIVRTDQSRVAFLSETVHSVDTIKLFNASGKRLTGWTRSLANYYKSSFKYSFTINTAAHLSLMIMNLLTIAILIVGVIEITNLAITVGALIAANTLGTRIVTPMVTFSGLVVRYRSIQQTLLYVQKFMDQPAEDYGLNNSSKKGPFKGGVQFDKVGFIYPNNKLPILSKCSFDIKPKEKVGIIGRTGAGKSTITRLLTGLDFPNEGVIKIDGMELENINIVELRKSIGFLPQKSQFFQASIRDNILLSSKNVTKEQYDRACALSGVDMLKELSGRGDDMIIQEGGTNISGGQQQIIALARAIINDPPIIIMDEPTNGMDTTLEAKFMENVAKYVKDKTFILITHRATQLSLVNRLILLERGNVVIDDDKDKVLSKLTKSK